MNVCSSCDKEIKPPSPIATYENRYYHPDCLKCNSCRKSLSGKQFIKEKNGNLVCEECNEKNSPKCKKCRLTFKAGQSYKKVSDDVYYHNECFICSGPCGKPMTAEFYDLENGKFLCTNCYDKYGTDYEKYISPVSNDDDSYIRDRAPPPIPKSEPPASAPSNRAINNLASRFDATSLDDKAKAPPAGKIESLPAVERVKDTPPATSVSRPLTNEPAKKPAEDFYCAKCNEKLTGQYTVYNDKKYHAKCFVCCQCNQEFTEKSFYKLNGNPLCRNCHSRNLVETSSKCNKCFQPILDTIVTFKNKEFHDYCLVCTECSKKLVGQSIYTDKQDKPFCVDCFTRKEGKTCAKCFKIIAPNQSNLVFEGKNFHKECFTCKQCSRLISATESFYRSEDNDDAVICEHCINK